MRASVPQQNKAMKTRNFTYSSKWSEITCASVCVDSQQRKNSKSSLYVKMIFFKTAHCKTYCIKHCMCV